jgi:hypothetical protein
VVLNKIDTLWDALSTPEQVKAQIDRQRATSAEILGLPESQVIPVSAQKGLVAKVTRDKALLEASHLPALELALGQGVMGQRQKILRSAVAAGIGELRTEAGRAMHIRRRDLAEQMIELRGLRGKNVSVIKHMRSRIEQEQAEFDTSGSKIHAVRSVHLKMLRDLFNLLSTPTLKAELAELTHALKQPGIKLGVKKAYSQTFSRLREGLQKVPGPERRNPVHADRVLPPAQCRIQLFAAGAQRAGTDPLRARPRIDRAQPPAVPGAGNVIKLSQADFSERLVRALATRLRVVYETALGEVELWNKSAASQLDAQLRERRRNFGRRLEAIERIQQAASGLDERIAEIDEQEVCSTSWTTSSPS